MSASCPPKADGQLRLVAWNVAGAFEKKHHMLRSLDPDIAVVAEACDEARLLRRGLDDHRTAAWIGRYPYKGLLVLTWGDEVKVQSCAAAWDQRLEWILPHRITAPVDLTLFGVWSQNASGEKRKHIRYPSETYRYPFGHLLDAYDQLLGERPAVLLGDFNHHVRWDRGDPTWDFAPIVDRYAERGLVSAWHAVHDVPIGHPSEPPTHWHTRNRSKPYHIDYCFVPERWVPAIGQVWIGGYDEWGATEPRSDHAPLVVDLDLDKL